ncbi:MAG TPA: helix-turn-helix transcriptional regulator [Allosphingosinicella sp.]|jgi:DNA-binding XRE family transcriptional regulator
MNTFNLFIDMLKPRLDAAQKIELIVDEPASSTGMWIATLSAADGYSIEVEWNRHRGFGLVAGQDLAFGSGVHELYGSAEAAADRVMNLLQEQVPTSTSSPVHLGELRKLRGTLQKDTANMLGVSKSALAQIEASDLRVLQLSTLKKLIESLGGELVLTARFPGGAERRIAVD